MYKPRINVVQIDEKMTISAFAFRDNLEKFMFATQQKCQKLRPSKIRGSLRDRRRRLAIIQQLFSNYIYDLHRFWNGSSVNGKINTQIQLRALITMDYHRIEKGLALKEPKIRFGSKVIERLLSNLSKYQEVYGLDETGQVALNTLSAYLDFNQKNGINDEQIQEKINKIREKTPQIEDVKHQGGVIEVRRQQILKNAQLNLQSFFESRYSIRQFTLDEVEMSVIEKAVAMAQKTPSVCNRQSSKVYVFSKDEDKQKVLTYQNGNRGFGNQASKILIVTSELEHFVSIGERNQCWIDGGMYAMSLVYALHSLGIGTCCLNWSVESQVDKALKEAVQIKDSESVIMMIAVGHLPDQLKVAQSPRKKVDEVLVVK